MILVRVIALIRDSLITGENRTEESSVCHLSHSQLLVCKDTQPWNEGELEMLTATLTFIAM